MGGSVSGGDTSGGRVVPWTARWSARRRCLRGSRGASTLEYLGVLGIVVAVVGSLLALNLSPQVVAATRDAVCEVLSLGCGTDLASGERAPADGTGTDGTGTDDGVSASQPGDGTGTGQPDGSGACQGVGGCALYGLGQLGSVLWNAGDAAVDEVVGIVTLVTQPGLIVDAIGYVVTNPLDALRQIVVDDETVELWGSGDYGGAVGRVLWNVGSVLIPGYNAAKAADALGTTGRVVGDLDDVASDVAGDTARRSADETLDTLQRVREDTTLTNVAAEIAAPEVLAKYQPGAGFSGAYNPATGEWVALASGDATLVSGQPAQTVSRFGGHQAAEEALVQRTGVTETSQNVGFVLIWQGDDTVQIRWNSGTINSRNFGDRAAPTEHRQDIIDAVRRTTGADVVE